MWIPLDERRLLAGYYHEIGAISRDATFHLSGLAAALNTYRPCDMHQYGYGPDAPIPENQKQIDEFLNTHIDVLTRARCANDRLTARGLIQTDTTNDAPNIAVVALTVTGYDLGRRYASWWDRTGLCFAAYKDHWITLVLSMLMAVVTSLVVNLLKT